MELAIGDDPGCNPFPVNQVIRSVDGVVGLRGSMAVDVHLFSFVVPVGALQSDSSGNTGGRVEAGEEPQSVDKVN
jgi:hypothetical protein